MGMFEKRIPPPLHQFLREAISEFYRQLPPDVAELKIKTNTPPSIFEAEIIPRSPKATRITVLAEDGDLEAIIGFGNECQLDARYYYGEHAEQSFKDEVLNICRTIAGNNWQEKTVMLGKRVFKSVAMLPPPLGETRTPGLGPFVFSRLRRKSEKVTNWEPYAWVVFIILALG